MKYMIASDIHGSGYYAERIKEKYIEEKCDRLILLGDILYHGPRNPLPKDYSPQAVAQTLNGLKDEIICVRGNCDADVDQLVLEFSVSSDIAILEQGKKLVYLTHGHIYNENSMPQMKKGDILVHGHTHVPTCKSVNGCTVLNPGSVSLPKENSHNGYMTLENGVFLWKDFDGTIKNKFEI